MEKFYGTWFKPNNGTVIVVGDTTLDEVKPKLEKLFATWKQGDVPKKNIGRVDRAPEPAIYLIDRPGAIQSMIFAGELAPPKSDPDDLAIEMMNRVLGGAFTSRINMNLREDKHWSYGAGTTIAGALGQRPFFAYAPVQTDKTKESVVEIDKELQGIITDHPVTEQELDKVQKQRTLELAGRWETMARIQSSIHDILRYQLPDDYYQGYADKIRALKLPKVEEAAKRVIHPKQLVWVVVGDRAKIEPGLRDLGFDQVKLIDTDGKVLATQ